MNGWTVSDLTDLDKLADCLTGGGMSASTAANKSERFADVAKVLLDCRADPSARAFACFVPGRIEVLGKHTDYAGGRSLIAAAERGFCGVAVARDDCSVQMIDVARAQQVECPLAPTLLPTQGSWSNYPMTVSRRLARNFPGPLRGATIAFSSDLPPAAGLSSSSALMVLNFLLLAEINELSQTNAYRDNIRSTESLAGYLGTIENGQSFGTLLGDRGVGTFGGSEDHTAILCSRPRQLAQFSYCPVQRERMVVLPQELIFVIAVSGVVAEKTGATMRQYNRASRCAQAVAELWRHATGRDDLHMAAAINSQDDAVERLRQILRQTPHPDFGVSDLIDRLEQFVAESQLIIPAVPDMISSHDFASFGQLVARSQTLGARLLGNQIPQTEFLAKQAGELGAIAASAFGAGFGGSVWALVHKDETRTFMNRWAQQYRNAFPADSTQAVFFESYAGPAAIPLGSSTPLPS